MSLDLSQDWKVIDDLQSVTYSSKTGEGTYNPGKTVANSFWEPLSEEDYELRPHLLQRIAQAVHFWTSQLNGIVPKLDDKIVDDANVSWYVDEVQRMDHDATGWQRYRCLCWQAT